MSGISRGLQLMADFLALLIKAFLHANSEAIKDCISVAQQWIRETVDESGVVKINPMSLLFGADPWRDSRMMYRACEMKWKGRI